MQKSNFRDWTLDSIDETFSMRQVKRLPSLDRLLSYSYRISEREKWYLEELQEVYNLGGDDWNEVELENKFISPLIVFAKIDNEAFAYFLERELSANINDYELSGKVDGMIASGFRSPKKPFFCLNEYKRQTDPNGDPRGQVLIAMLVAQKVNENGNPIFGCYIIGRSWYFVALEGQNYAISNVFSCTNDEIFKIFGILKSLKTEIEKSLG